MSDDKPNDDLKKQAALYWKCCFDFLNKHFEDTGSDIRFIVKDEECQKTS